MNRPNPPAWKRALVKDFRKNPPPTERQVIDQLKKLGFVHQLIVCGYIADFAHIKSKIVIELDHLLTRVLTYWS
jgi:very-short-patch-repair endonuclease